VTTDPEFAGFGVNVKLGAKGTLNVTSPKSPVVPVIVTVYGPLVPDATVKDPDIAPPATVHSGLEIRPPGDEVMEHPVSPPAKFEPETRTVVPGRPEAGSIEIFGVSTKLAEPASKPPVPVTVTI
jgi:hypothetical protein